MITADVEDIHELTPLQHGMLFHSIAEPESAMYFEQISFDLPGLLDLSRFQHAWDVLVDRHQVLRTSFFWEDLERPLQVVHRRASITIVREDWTGLPDDAVEARFRQFLATDRETGLPLDRAPLMRISLFRIHPRCHRFVASFHHALLDGWSLGNLFSEFRSVYEALLRGGPFPLRPVRPYADYLRWLQEQDPTVAEAHWQRILAGYDGPAPLAMLDATGGEFVEIEAFLGASAMSRLNDVASDLKVTVNTIVQGAWGVLLGRFTGERDVVFGAVVSGRPPSLPGVESMVGLFINTIPVRANVTPERSLAEYFDELQAQQAIGREHAYVSLVEIQGWSDVPRGVPLFNTLLIFENQPMGSTSDPSPSDDVATAVAFERTNYPITILVSPGRRLGIKVQCLGGSMDVATSIADHFVTLLEAVGRNPHRQIASLSMLTAGDYDALQRVGRGPQVDREFVGLHELFVRQAAAAPTAIAVLGAGQTWTYDELKRRSDAIASGLAELGVGRGDVVGVLGPRSPVLAAMLLGVLQVGAAFLPLDRCTPSPRIEFMLSDSRAAAVLTSPDLAPLLQSVDAEVLEVDDTTTTPDGDPQSPTVLPDDLAYVTYTSGSTGRPKGVMQTQGATVNRFQWMWEAFPFAADEVACHKTALTFVDAIWEIFGPLLRGIPLRFIDEETVADPDRFVDELARGRVTRLLVVPSLLRVLIELHDDLGTRLPDLTLCVSSGEPLTPDLAARFIATLPHATLVNLYGSSEVAADVTVAVLSDDSAVNVPIGTPIDNVTAYVFDDRLQPVAFGVPGELHIGGAALARGYLGQPGLTAERFVPDPYADGGRLFRTGDLARWRPNGQLEFVGRRDHQVKLRGVRVELGEVEAALMSCPGVDQALVAVQDEHTARARLVAQLTTADRSLLPATVRAAVADHLPDAMVPAVIEIVDALPLLSNGKVDRLAVAARRTSLEAADRPERPASETERTLAALWQEVLDVSVTDRRSNFFALGGHSLTVMQLGSRIRREFGVEVPLPELFDAATLERQARRIDARRRNASGTGDHTIRRLNRSSSDVHHPSSNDEGGGGG